MAEPEPSDAQREWLAASEAAGPQFDALADPPPRLLVLGAVPLAVELTRAARAIGWGGAVIDPRERLARPELFPDADAVVVDWPVAAFHRLGGLDDRTGVVALAHAPELDDDGVVAALRSEAFYVGALGSRRTQARRRERLAGAGVEEAALARLSGPAGLDLGGRTRAEAALAILAEAVAARHGRRGGRLSDSDGAIHVGPRPAG